MKPLFIPKAFWLIIFVFAFSLQAKFPLKKIQSAQYDGKSFSVLDVGNWRYYQSCRGNSGFGDCNFYPRDGVRIMYLDGILWAGWLKDPQTGKKILIQPLRAGGNAFYSDIPMQPGWIDENGQPVDPTGARAKIYRYTRKHEKGFEIWDAAYLLNLPIDQVSWKDHEQIYFQEGEDAIKWPVDLGAPFLDFDQDRAYHFPTDVPGYAWSDQILWTVANDLIDKDRMFYRTGSFPIGMELKTTTWTYSGKFSPGGQMIFKRYQLINKSPYLLDSLFIGIYLDPDIGDYKNDLAGCDSTANFFFAYNNGNTDKEIEGEITPAIGAKILQGPMVYTGNPQDTALFHQEWQVGYKNLNLHAFGYYAPFYYEINPPTATNLTAVSIYNALRGYWPSPSLTELIPYVVNMGPNEGETTRFPLNGDPLTGQGEIDGQGVNYHGGDRYLLGSFGPLAMAPGDEQEIIFAIIGGQGTNYLSSLAEVKKMFPYTEAIFQAGFKDVPRAPEAPKLKAVALGDKIVLNWGFDAELVRQIENEVHAGYAFEGYNVYQLKPIYDESSIISGNPARFEKIKIATFDKVDGIFTIKSWYYDEKKGENVFGLVQRGTDSGIKRHLVIDWDYFNDCPLYRGSTYYYMVSAYNYNPQVKEFATFESNGQMVELTLQECVPGTRYLASAEDTIAFQKNQENDVRCQLTVVDPSQLTGHDYEINFIVDQDTSSNHYSELLWKLNDLTLQQTIIQAQPLLAFSDWEKSDGVFVDGLNIKVAVPEDKFIRIYQYADSYGPIIIWTSPDQNQQQIGYNVWHSLSSPNDDRFYLSSAINEDRLSLNPYLAYLGHDFEMRFTDEGSLFYWYYDSIQVAGQVPFEFWDVGPGTFEDSTDDVRLIAIGNSGGHTPGVFDYGPPDPIFGFPASDWIYVRYPLNEKGSYQAFVPDVSSGAPTLKWYENSVPIFGPLTICDFTGSGVLPATGVVIRFATPKYPDENFKITFTAPGKIENDLELMKKDVKKINVFPNPYYAASSLERDRFEHFVTFNHLPPHAIIRIFTLNGTLVRKLEKNDPSQFFRWDLKNEKGWRVASGLYIVHIDMPELKKQKILKLMVITGEETLEYY
ncbi:MAG: T9SS type A sorting domain-containing protein [Caldisericaceae bacterium]|nr:T9SS type A sorting domain-containing protein [Caldisericaceae bacterium]